jgi:hypothetical protein
MYQTIVLKIEKVKRETNKLKKATTIFNINRKGSIYLSDLFVAIKRKDTLI